MSEGVVSNTSTGAPSAVVADVSLHKAVIEDFLSAIRDGSEPRCNGTDGRRSVALVEALYRSADTGSPVNVPRD